eukprot:CAMPEP_0117647738 /NCGR_PEP_ID=MMETSP0804-20121206/4_1 /TAXON_ID=1074897 /ORGANISM="Tetraselmis astigmatica, Strain CCMP880" /LENGTH=410 /DNA_ID=CAMNT_0005453239 /DNA_START=470 /DNA_END=1702 /DNA_ORIENTATION=+
MTSPQAKVGYAIGKIWCLPFLGHSCNEVEKEYARMTMDKILAVDKVSVACGFVEIVPRSWIETVTTIIPGLGYVYHGEVLMMEVAEGASVKAIDKLPAAVQDEAYQSLNRTQVLLAGIFDTLMQQRDRNTGNVFLSESNQLALIDNDKVLAEKIDSVFIPNSQYYNANIFGREFVRYNGYNISQAPSPTSTRTSVVLDYRCYAHEGVVGVNYPPKVKQCLADISAATPEKIQREYGFPDVKYAAALWDQARVMAHRGMEWALDHSSLEHPCLAYFWHKPCCRWRAVSKEEKPAFGSRMRCADESWAPWNLEHKLPCKNFDYMFVKYRMIESSMALGQEFDIADWLAWVTRSAPPVRCTAVQAGREDTPPWLLHTQHREVDPTLYCVKTPGGEKWHHYMTTVKHLRGQVRV